MLTLFQIYLFTRYMLIKRKTTLNLKQKLTSFDARLAILLSSLELFRTSAHASCRLCSTGAQDAATKSKRTTERVFKQRFMTSFFGAEFAGSGFVSAVRSLLWVMDAANPAAVLYTRGMSASPPRVTQQGFPGYPSGEFMCKSSIM